MKNVEIAIIGAGASGLFCASLLAEKGFSVHVFDNGKHAARKILISGGGKCNFTNLFASAENYLSQNPHFCKSALKQFTQFDFLQLIEEKGILYEQRENGKLFCQNSAKEIVHFLVEQCEKNKVNFHFKHELIHVSLKKNEFLLGFSSQTILAKKLIVASGGLSFSRLGATSIGYKIANQFSIPIIQPKSGLVPLVLPDNLLKNIEKLSGIGVFVSISTNSVQFKDFLLFTHFGLSGPAILQISNFWQKDQPIFVNFFPNQSLELLFNEAFLYNPKQTLKRFLREFLPKRLITFLLNDFDFSDFSLNQLNEKQKKQLFLALQSWEFLPNGTKGYEMAEITLGGIDTNFISSKTFEVKNVKNLYFIGEVLDVSGQLGGFNFQWCWSSAFSCAKHILV